MNIPREHELFRWSLSLYLVWYYLQLLPSFFVFFSRDGMVSRTLLHPRYPSLFFIFDSNFSLVAGLVTLLILVICFALGKLNRLGLLTLIAIHVSFHNINPLIIHEPQQLSNLFLVLFLLFLPIRNRQECDPKILQICIAFLAFYYFVAGVKKLPDPMWRSGEALRLILIWPGFQKQNWVNGWLATHPIFTSTFSFATLAFELLAPLGIFIKRLRPFWMVAGLVFHTAIAVALEVGTFSAIMIASYALLLNPSTLRTLTRPSSALIRRLGASRQLKSQIQ